MNIQMRLNPEIHEAAKRAAALEGVALSEYLRGLLARNLEMEGNDEMEEGAEQIGD
jgi:predicted HicB family RNase H-like nuclease